MSRNRLDEHRRIWQKKPALAKVYQKWFDELLAVLPSRARVLEVGAGPGFLSAYVRAQSPTIRWLTMDILETSWNDMVADAQRIPLRDRTLDALVGFDLLHHITRPASFFEQAAGVLVPGGRIAVVEPWVTALSYPIYRWLHHEGCNLRLDPWNPFAIAEGQASDAFLGDSAAVWRLVGRTSERKWRELGFLPPQVKTLNGFAYLLSCGFKEYSLLPASLVSTVTKLDELIAGVSPYLGMRALAVWERSLK